jgi:hypothetical protein
VRRTTAGARTRKNVTNEDSRKRARGGKENPGQLARREPDIYVPRNEETSMLSSQFRKARLACVVASSGAGGGGGPVGLPGPTSRFMAAFPGPSMDTPRISAPQRRGGNSLGV